MKFNDTLGELRENTDSHYDLNQTAKDRLVGILFQAETLFLSIALPLTLGTEIPRIRRILLLSSSFCALASVLAGAWYFYLPVARLRHEVAKDLSELSDENNECGQVSASVRKDVQAILFVVQEAFGVRPPSIDGLQRVSGRRRLAFALFLASAGAGYLFLVLSFAFSF